MLGQILMEGGDADTRRFAQRDSPFDGRGHVMHAEIVAHPLRAHAQSRIVAHGGYECGHGTQLAREVRDRRANLHPVHAATRPGERATVLLLRRCIVAPLAIQIAKHDVRRRPGSLLERREEIVLRAGAIAVREAHARALDEEVRGWRSQNQRVELRARFGVSMRGKKGVCQLVSQGCVGLAPSAAYLAFAPRHR